MMEISYGHPVTSLDDEFIVLADNAISGSTETGSAAASLIDFFPIRQSLCIDNIGLTHTDTGFQCVMFPRGCPEQASGRKSKKFASSCV